MNKKNAAVIGIITVMSYVANYFLRNMLGVLTPSILKATSYTKEYLALLSSTYMIAYAAGQLLNGVLGDVFKPKMMVLIGLSAAGAVSVAFLLLALVMNSLVSALLWSIYIPGLGKTGRVSSINGILDCTGYVAASAATTVFAYVVSAFGWTGLIISWSIIPITGIIASLGKGQENKAND